ncbi:MAG: hypothetical protein IJ710_03725 [Prevotella sp.]|nr:hypothetical protein [Prevotella sp.]
MTTKNTSVKTETTEKKSRKRKYSKTWEAAMRLKGSIIVNDPALLL